MQSGKIISIWSNSKKVGKTLILYNLLRKLSEKCPTSKFLAVDMNFKYGNLLKMFHVENDIRFDQLMLPKIGLDKSIDYGVIMKRNGETNIYLNDLELFDSTFTKANLEKYAELLKDYARHFDVVFVDLISGNQNPLTNIVLDNSDYVINVLTQDKEQLDKGFERENDLFYIINMYNQDVFPKMTDIKSLYKIEKDIYKTPYCPELIDMKNREILGQYGDTKYMENISSIAEKIIEEIDLCGAEKEDKKKRVFGGLFSRKVD